MFTLAPRPFLLVMANEGGVGRFIAECLAESFTSCVAETPEEALAVLESGGGAVDFVVSDLGFGSRGECDWVGEVRKYYPVNPLVVMASAPTAVLVREAIRAGASDFLFKPFGVTELLDTASRLMSSPSLLAVWRSNARGLATTLGFKDPDTLAHVSRVARLTVRLGREFGFGARSLAELEMAALLHDVGKIGVRDEILCKPSCLTHPEKSIMRRHSIIGSSMLRDFDFPEAVIRAVGQHHEHWDGTGYPDGLKGEGIEPAARLLAVADAFDAMTADRVYREARPVSSAVEELSAYAGTQFDPEAVRRFLAFIADEWDQLRAEPAAPAVSIAALPSREARVAATAAAVS